MSIDVDSEQLIPFTDATRSFPGRSVCIQTLHRWRLHGVRGTKLETCMIGGFRFTSKEAISRFINAQNAGDSKPANLTLLQRAKSAAARRELEAMGV